MSNICSEKDLILYGKTKIIEYLRLKAAEPGQNGYELWVKVQGKEELLLVTFHTKKGRIWVSVDRAIAHIKKKYHYAGRIYIDL